MGLQTLWFAALLLFSAKFLGLFYGKTVQTNQDSPRSFNLIIKPGDQL
jgi:hypothetical protein